MAAQTIEAHPITVIVADDHPAIREWITVSLGARPNIEIAGAASSGKEAVLLAKDNPSSVIIMDISMPIMDGIVATKKILKNNPDQKIIVYTGSYDENGALELLKAGASGYIRKGADINVIINAINAVLSGYLYIEHESALNFKTTLNGDQYSDGSINGVELTEIDRKVISMRFEGKSKQDIAASLKMNPRTISRWNSELCSKLGVDKKDKYFNK